MEDYRFRVNLGGMIEILSDHLYSSPDVYIRELLQNGVDAITGRKNLQAGAGGQEGAARDASWNQEAAFAPGIILEIEEGRGLTFTDNGQGLTEEEIHQFLAIIGESSKKNPEDGRIRTDYIGRFGIGLLSCFMVSDEIRVITRSCRSEDAPLLEWRGKPDGTYTISGYDGEQAGEQEREQAGGQEQEQAGGQEREQAGGQVQKPAMEGFVGTKVILSAKPGKEDYFTGQVIEKLITYYGMLLPFPIVIRRNGEEKQINPSYLPWEGRDTNKQELMLFGQMMFEEQFFDCVPFSSQKGNVSGVAYILKYPVLPSARSSHRIYLKNMLLTEKGDNLIPDWAVFTKCIVNAADLRPTASREGFYVDEMLNAAREAIEDGLIEYIAGLAEKQPDIFQEFFRIHHLTLISLALAAPKLFHLLVDYCEFETTRGVRTGYDLRTCGEPLLYAPTEARYKQLSQLFFAQDKQLINVSYVHSLDLLKGLGDTYDIEVRAVDEWNVEDLMKDLSPKDQDESYDFQKTADRILRTYDCRAELKYFSPVNQPTFYLMDEKVLLKRRIAEARRQARSMFFNMLDAFSAEIGNDRAAVLYFNYDNPLVKKLAECGSEEDIKLFVEILYVQALQIGGFPLHNNELGMLNRNILNLMERGLSDV